MRTGEQPAISSGTSTLAYESTEEMSDEDAVVTTLDWVYVGENNRSPTMMLRKEVAEQLGIDADAEMEVGHEQ